MVGVSSPLRSRARSGCTQYRRNTAVALRTVARRSAVLCIDGCFDVDLASRRVRTSEGYAGAAVAPATVVADLRCTWLTGFTEHDVPRAAEKSVSLMARTRIAR